MMGRTGLLVWGCVALISIGAGLSSGKTTSSLRDGNWSDPIIVNPVWDNGTPAAGDAVNISHHITLDSQFLTPSFVAVDSLNVSGAAGGFLTILSSRSLNVATLTNNGTIAHGGLLVRADGIDGAGSIIMSAATTLNAAHVRQKFLNIGTSARASIVMSGADSAASRFETLTIAGSSGSWSGVFDLANNALVIDYTGGSPLATIKDQIATAWHGGDWTGKGLASSTAANVFADTSAAHKTGIGFGEATDILSTFPNTFAGQPVDTTSVVARYTLYGDASLDKSVDTVDFNLLTSNFGGSGKRWTQGDFNYDGLVDTIDFNVMASNFGQAVAADSLSTMTVPEPSVISVFFIFVLPTLRGAGASCRSR